MILKESEVAIAFDDLIAGTKSREEISAWAQSRIAMYEAKSLSFDPESCQPKAWEALKYLLGVDLRVTPTEYLHDIPNFQEFRNKLGI